MRIFGDEIGGNEIGLQIGCRVDGIDDRRASRVVVNVVGPQTRGCIASGRDWSGVNLAGLGLIHDRRMFQADATVAAEIVDIRVDGPALMATHE